MARPSVKSRCGGLWTEAKYRNFIKNLLRSGTMKWGPKQKCLANARTRRGFYECAECKREVPATIAHPGTGKRTKNIIVDHNPPIIDPEVGFTTWDDFIEKMFCELDSLQAICHACHTSKTSEERSIATARRRQEKLDAE